MGCLKCGETTQAEHVFCPTCMEVMQRYPVKPDTAVSIPRRETPSAERKPVSRAEPTPKQQLARLRAIVKWLLAVIVILSLLLCLVGVMLIRTLDQPSGNSNIGRNYTTNTQRQP